LASMGVRASVPEIVTSTSATIGYLRHHLPEAHHVLAVGSQAMIAALRAAALEVTLVAEVSHPGYQGETLKNGDDAGGAGPDADIVAGHRSGIFTVLILTGVADAVLADGLAGERKPDLVVADHAELGRQFDQWLS